MMPFILVTCEHASNSIPPSLAHLFIHNGDVLDTHRAWDIGAAEVASAAASLLNAPFFAGTLSRLVVDLNRSETNRTLFSVYTRTLRKGEKDSILNDYYRPYRHDIRNRINLILKEGFVLHAAVHSFTPVLNGVKRECDIGLLYDPSRTAEKSLASRWKKLLEKHGYRVRMNYPYRGKSDGLACMLRKSYDGMVYAGIEVEVNQALLKDSAGKRIVAVHLAETIRALLDEFSTDN